MLSTICPELILSPWWSCVAAVVPTCEICSQHHQHPRSRLPAREHSRLVGPDDCTLSYIQSSWSPSPLKYDKVRRVSEVDELAQFLLTITQRSACHSRIHGLPAGVDWSSSSLRDQQQNLPTGQWSSTTD